MNNYEKIIKEMQLEELRMLLADVEAPIRCVFCVYSDVHFCNQYKSKCIDGIDKFLRSEVAE